MSRTKVGTQRVTGTISEWKGKFGWIEGDSPVNHPEAARNRGRIYLSVQDVEEEIEGVGSQVSFFVYADGSGLGAMNVRPHDGSIITPIKKPVLQGGGKSSPWQALGKQSEGRPAGRGPKKQWVPEPRESIEMEPITGTIQRWQNMFGWVVPDEPVDHPAYRGRVYLASDDCDNVDLCQPGAVVSFTLYTDSQGIGAENCTLSGEMREVPPDRKRPREGTPKGGANGASGGKGERVAKAANTGKGAGAGAVVAAAAAAGPVVAAGPKGGPKKRTRISELELIGEIIEWKGNFGWIQPQDTVDHPLAKKRGGKIHLAAADITGDGEVKSLEPGQLVQFHVFTDGSGLGAEECLPF